MAASFMFIGAPTRTPIPSVSSSFNDMINSSLSSRPSIGFRGSSYSSSSLYFEKRFQSVPSRRRACFVLDCLPSSYSPKSTSSSTTRLYVSGLSFRTTDESLRNAFKNFGELLEVNLVMDKVANRPRGFAFLRYTSEEESQKAIEGMHGKFLDGRVIFVEVAKPRSELQRNPKQNPPRY